MNEIGSNSERQISREGYIERGRQSLGRANWCRPIGHTISQRLCLCVCFEQTCSIKIRDHQTHTIHIGLDLL